MFMTFLTFPSFIIFVALILDTLANIYDSLNFIPFGTMVGFLGL
jgi:hypothetical protein